MLLTELKSVISSIWIKFQNALNNHKTMKILCPHNSITRKSLIRTQKGLSQSIIKWSKHSTQSYSSHQFRTSSNSVGFLLQTKLLCLPLKTIAYNSKRKLTIGRCHRQMWAHDAQCLYVAKTQKHRLLAPQPLSSAPATGTNDRTPLYLTFTDCKVKCRRPVWEGLHEKQRQKRRKLTSQNLFYSDYWR